MPRRRRWRRPRRRAPRRSRRSRAPAARPARANASRHAASPARAPPAAAAAVGSPRHPSLHGVRRDRRAPRDRLEAPAAPAVAARAVRLDDDVADVARVPARAVDAGTAEDDAAADAGRDDHPEDVLVATAGAPPVLGQGEADGVVVDRDGQPDAVAVAHAVEEGEVAPGRDVDRGDVALGPGHRTAAPDADASERHLSAISQQGVDQVDDHGPQHAGVVGHRAWAPARAAGCRRRAPRDRRRSSCRRRRARGREKSCLRHPTTRRRSRTSSSRRSPGLVADS